MPDMSTRRATPSLRLPRNRFGALHMHSVEGHVTLLSVGRDGIDNRIDPFKGGGD
jgi:hypothetical protein